MGSEQIAKTKTPKSYNDVSRLIDGAEEAPHPVEALIDASKSDPGAPFRPENLELLADLKNTNPAKFENIRARLKQQRVRVSELDQYVVKPICATPGSTGAGEPLSWTDDEPWPDPVDGRYLLNEIVAELLRFMVLPQHCAEAIALWIVFAHAHDAFSVSPRLAFLSPEKRCGKTTALSIVQELVPKRLSSSNITTAAVFRSIEKYSPTLLIDEADTFLTRNDELRGILNSGHNKRQAFVIRSVGDEHEPRKFCTWAPVVIAMIGSLPDTLADRSIIVPLRRKKREERVERYRADRIPALGDLRRKIARWITDNQTALKRWDGELPMEIHDRAADNWRPLFATANAAGGEWLEKARHASISLTAKVDSESKGVTLLVDLKQLFENSKTDRLKTDEILSTLSAMDDRPWPEYRNGNPLTARQLAALLKPYAINAGTIRFDNGTAKGYRRKAFNDAFARYLPSNDVTPSQTSETAICSPQIAVTLPSNVTHEKSKKREKSGAGDVVTVRGAAKSCEHEDWPEMPKCLRRI